MSASEVLKLIEFNSDNTQSHRQSKPKLSAGQGGRFRLSSSGAIMIGAVPGDRLAFYREESDQSNWYIQNKGKVGSGFTLRWDQKPGRKSIQLTFDNRKLFNLIRQSLSQDNNTTSIHFKIGEKRMINGSIHYPLLFLKPQQ